MNSPLPKNRSHRLRPMMDARHFQILYLGSFLLFGLASLGWDLSVKNTLLTFGIVLAWQSLFIAVGKAHISSWRSALITGLGLCLLFRANDPTTIVLASSLAIGSKFFFRFKGKHLFNPANIGIIGAILLTQDGWISPGQWGSSVVFLFVLGALGSIVLLRVGRLDTTLTFLLVFVALEYGRTILYLGWSHDVLFHKLSNGSFLLFAFFMITDPKTAPDHPIARKLWAIAIAITAFIMSHWLYIHTAPIWALFIITPLTALCDALMKGERFSWTLERLKPHIS